MGEASVAKEYILVLIPIAQDGKADKIIADLKSKHPNIEIDVNPVQFRFGKAELTSIPDETWKKTTILVTLGTLPSNLDIIPNLKLIHLFSAGLSAAVTSSPIWSSTKIPITNSSGVHGPQISEWVILQMLSFQHAQKKLLAWQKEHVWGKSSDLGPLNDSVKQRLGVLGYGAIGRQTARVAQALGMDVIAYTATPRSTPDSKRDTGYIVPGTGDMEGLIPSKWYSGTDKASLHTFLKAEIDILLISLPLTATTKHSLGKDEFALLSKKKAFVINIARGPIVVQDELIAALKDGTLRGAALDVTDPEPLPKESELWDLENTTVTPHVSGHSSVYAERSFQILERNLTALERGEDLINVVSREKGY